VASELLRCFSLFFVVFMAGVATAEVQTLPPRDRVPPQQTGTGRIKGRVVDAQSGSALPRARVRVLGQGNLLPSLTDESGRFEFDNLPAGRFFLNVDKSGYAFGRYPDVGPTVRGGGRPLVVADHETIADIVIPMYRGSAITGRVLDAHGDPLEFTTVQAFRVPRGGRGAPQPRQMTSTNDLGEFRLSKLEPGSYLVAVMPRGSTDVALDLQPVPTYFPNTVSRDEAQPIVVERAQTISGVEIVAIESITGMVSGTVIDPKGVPVAVGFINARRTSGTFADHGGSGTSLRDGTFKMYLPVGEYELEARAMRPGMTGPVAPADDVVGISSVSVTGAPISDVSIQLGAAAVITGRIVFDGQIPPPEDPQSVRLGLAPMMPNSTCRSGRFDVFPDWTFRIEGAFGTCTIPPSRAGRWLMKSAGRENLNFIDGAVRIAPGQNLSDIQVVFTDRRTELSLEVSDDHGLPTREYVALVFSRDRKRWTENSRYVRLYLPPPPPPQPAASNTLSAGQVKPQRDVLVDLPPGEYYAVAVEDLPTEGNRDPAVLESLMSLATRVTLSDAAPLHIALRRVAAFAR